MFEILGDEIPPDAYEEAERLAARLTWPKDENFEIRIFFAPSYMVYDSENGGMLVTEPSVEGTKYYSCKEPLPKTPFCLIISTGGWRKTLAHELKHLSDYYLGITDNFEQRARKFVNKVFRGPDND